MDILWIALCVILLAILSYKGLHIILASMFSAALLCILLKLNVYDCIMKTMMPGMGNFVASYLPMFLLGALLSRLMEISGATESIANILCNTFGTKYVMIALCLLGSVLTIGGISMYVAFFACTPIAVSMLRRADLPRRLWIGAWTAGTCTYAMTGPFAPTMQNAVGVKLLGTTISAGWQVGLIGWIPFAIVILVHEYRSGIRAKKRGEHFVPRPDELSAQIEAEKALPHWILPCIPIAVLFILTNAFRFDIETGMFCSLILCVICLWKYLPHDQGSLSNAVGVSFQNAGLSIINPAIIVGFASLVTSTPVFENLSQTVAALKWDPFLTAAGFAGITACLSGSCMAGLNVTFETCMKMFQNTGINLETLHRVATMGAGTIDSLPHCGAINGYAAVTKEKIRDIYGDVFFCSVLCPIGATLLAVAAAYLLGYAYL